MTKITFNNHEGFLNVDTEEVYFYHLKYINISEAVKHIDHDAKAYEEEIKTVNKMLENLFVENVDD